MGSGPTIAVASCPCFVRKCDPFLFSEANGANGNGVTISNSKTWMFSRVHDNRTYVSVICAFLLHTSQAMMYLLSRYVTFDEIVGIMISDEQTPSSLHAFAIQEVLPLNTFICTDLLSHFSTTD